MKFRRSAKLEHGLEQIDIVPLINIIFLLLIFFMFFSNFVLQPGIRVDLPKAVTSEVVKPENIEILVSGENVAYFEGKPVTAEEIGNLLKQVSGRNPSILIKADRQASLGRVVEIWDLARGLGIKQVNIATNQK